MTNWYRNSWLVLIFLMLVLPFVIVAGVSLGTSTKITFPPTGLTLEWYWNLFGTAEWLRPLRNSATIALGAAIIASLIALAANYFLWRTKSGFGRLIVAVGMAPFLLPPIILALGASIFWAYAGLFGNIWATIISHSVFFAPLPIIIIGRGFAGLSGEVIEASQTLGASDSVMFRTVIFPLITPYVVTGFALVAIISFNEYLVSNMISGFLVETLPIKIFNNVRYGYSPMLASAAMGFVFITAGVLFLVSRFTDLLDLFGGTGRD